VSATGLLPACRPTSTGDAPEVGLAYTPGGPIPWRNWAGNQACQPAARLAPESEDELLSMLAGAVGPIRPVGAGHSFSALVPSDGTLVATDFLSGLLSVDAERQQCEVGSGTRLHQLGPLLEAEGLALPNMPDIAYQTVAGAIGTSTHGTGVTLGSLSSFVEGLTIATPAGELIECDRAHRPELFAAARCSLGSLGVITRVRLQCQPSFRLAQRVRFEPLEEVLDDVERRRVAHRHFEVLAFPHASLAHVMETDEDDTHPDHIQVGEEDPQALRDAYRLLGAVPLIGDALYDAAFRATVAGEETVWAGASWRVLTHQRIQRFREMEYTVPADAGAACVRELMQVIRDREIPLVYPIEIRWVKQDDIWLSMFNGRDGCTLSIHQYADEDHRPVYEALEPILWKYGGRPHWGKLHSLDAASLEVLYPRWREFNAVRESMDAEGRMLNGHLRTVLGA